MNRCFNVAWGWMAVVLVFILPTMAMADNYTYVTNDDGTISITRYVGVGGDIQIPENIEGRAVSGIKDMAFYKYANPISVSIPSGVTNIGSSGLYNSPGLTAIHVDSSNAFYSSADGVLFDKAQTRLIQYPGGKVGEYIVPDGVAQIKSNAFTFCGGLTRIEIGPGVTNIGMASLSPCTNLAEIAVDAENPVYRSAAGVLFGKDPATLIQCPPRKTGSYSIPEGIVQIGPAAFACCGLSDLHFPASVSVLGQQPFYECGSLVGFTVDENNALFSSAEGVLYDEEMRTLVRYPQGRTGVFVIPSGVTDIGSSAFRACSNLMGVVVAESVTNIMAMAFWECGNLETWYFKGAAPAMAFQALFGVPFTATAYYLVGTAGWGGYLEGLDIVPWRSAEGYELRLDPGDVNALTLTDYNGSGGDVVIPAHVEYLEDKTITGIGAQAFNYSGVTRILIGDSVTNIGDEAFSSCTSLTNVIVGDGVLRIGNRAFSGCSSLTQITLGRQVGWIGYSAFQNAVIFGDVYFLGDAPTLESSIFSSHFPPTIYYMPGTTNWGTTFGGCTTMLWNPAMQCDEVFGAQTNGFGFTLKGTSNLIVGVEACTDLANPVWTWVGNCTLSGGTCDFRDLEWTNHIGRYYRICPRR